MSTSKPDDTPTKKKESEDLWWTIQKWVLITIGLLICIGITVYLITFYVIVLRRKYRDKNKKACQQLQPFKTNIATEISGTNLCTYSFKFKCIKV